MSRNPFMDLGFPPDEAAALHIRSQLAAVLERHISRKGWNQAEAARTLKAPQPTISKIVNGNIEKLSIEFLVKLAVRAGLPVSISVGRTAPIAKLGSRIAERSRNVGLRTDFPELRGQAARPAEFKR